MRKKLGTFKLNLTDIDLYVDSESRGGSFSMCYQTGKRSWMVIGINANDVVSVYERLLHEAMEGSLYLRGAVNRGPCGEVGYNAYYNFSFTHEVWQRAVNDASRFLIETQKLVYAEFRKLNPKAPIL